jgi:hypothetical protein
MKKYFIFLLALTALFTSCEEAEELFGDAELKGKHVYCGGTTKVKVGSWSTETVGNGCVEIDLNAGTFKLTAGSVNTKTELEIIFGKGFTNDAPALYFFNNVDAMAMGDYWRETTTDIYWYSQVWGSGLYGDLEITTLTEDLIEGEFEFKGIDTAEDFKERTVQGSFSIPK